MQCKFNRNNLDQLLERWSLVLAGRLIGDAIHSGTDDQTIADAMHFFPWRLEKSLRLLFDFIEEETDRYVRMVQEVRSVRLDGFSPPDRKIAVIRTVREITDLGLKEAKELVEAAPKMVKEGISEEEANAIVSRLAQEGGQATIVSGDTDQHER